MHIFLIFGRLYHINSEIEMHISRRYNCLLHQYERPITDDVKSNCCYLIR